MSSVNCTKDKRDCGSERMRVSLAKIPPPPPKTKSPKIIYSKHLLLAIAGRKGFASFRSSTEVVFQCKVKFHFGSPFIFNSAWKRKIIVAVNTGETRHTRVLCHVLTPYFFVMLK